MSHVPAAHMKNISLRSTNQRVTRSPHWKKKKNNNKSESSEKYECKKKEKTERKSSEREEGELKKGTHRHKLNRTYENAGGLAAGPS